MTLTTIQLIGLIAAGLVAGYLVNTLVSFIIRRSASRKAKAIREEALAESERIKKDALLASKEDIYRLREDFERKNQEIRQDLKEQERRLSKREDALDRKADILQRQEKELEVKDKSFQQKLQEAETHKQELRQLIENEKKTLHQISGLNRDDAVKLLLSRLEQEMQQEMVSIINKTKEQTRETVDTEAKKQIALAVQRLASDYTGEITVSTIDLANDDMKGRIIGREGRNIRTFEKVTGVDVIVDDTPGVIVISAFDGVRREIARRSMEKLILDGRIHPGRIEEIVDITKKEVETVINQTGKKITYDLNIHGINPKLVTLLGRLKYRTSYGQNVLEHSIEVAQIAGTLAGELGFDAVLAKRCGLLHDIGKAVDQEMEGTHSSIGAELAKRFDERPEVVDAIERHHEMANPEFIYTVLTAAADAISAARPGSRRESVETYIKRLERLEAIANSYEGVENSYAIQAGRELRVIVNASKIDDNRSTIIARNIANDIEKELKYPGEIKVTIIRETRVIEYAR